MLTLASLPKDHAMPYTILCPVDFSAASLGAARYASQLCLELQAQLRLLHIVQVPVVYGEIPIPVGNYDEVLEKAREEMEGLVRMLHVEMGTGLPIDYEVKMGSPMTEILADTQNVAPLLMVMGTRGLGSFERFVMGSNTLNAIKRCCIPVLAVPENYGYVPINRLGLASDFKDVVKKTPQQLLVALAKGLDAELHILHNDPSYHEYEPKVMLEGMLLDTMFSGISHSFHFLHSEFTEEGIANFAQAEELNWLIIIPGKHGFFDEIFGHQHAPEFVLHATMPVLVVPADGNE